MNIRKSVCVSALLALIFVGQSAQAFDETSLNGCYAISLYGNILGPQFTVDATTGELVPNTQTLVPHGTASVGRLCFDGAGNLSGVQLNQNVAGLCTVFYADAGTGTYTVLDDGIGNAFPSVLIPDGVVLDPKCALLDVNFKPGAQATFTYSLVLEGQDCMKIGGLSVATLDPATGVATRIPIVTEGEACLQTPDGT